MDLLRLLDQLFDIAVKRPKRVLGLPIYRNVDLDEIGVQISKIRAMLPEEMRQAAGHLQESDRVLVEARQDATRTTDEAHRESERLIADAKTQVQNILEEARTQQARLIAESEVIKISKAQAEEIRNAADRDAVATRRAADQYALDVLTKLGDAVGRLMTSIERAQQEFQPIRDLSTEKRDKVRLG